MSGASLGRIGQYELRSVLGRGGMATVYRAYQPGLDRDVAIKVIAAQHARDPAFLERFRREARLVARLRHPQILAVYDFGEAHGAAYLVSELIEGGTLQSRLGRPLNPRDVVQLARQIGAALDYAHSQGLIHRDIKPANIFLDGQRAVLADFGIAKTVAGSEALTKTGLSMGTPEYMAPEQALGEPLDGRADLYALAVVLYEALTGSVPYHADTPVNTISQHLHGQLPRPSERNPALSPAIERVLIAALSRQRADRYPSGAELANALETAVTQGNLGWTPPPNRVSHTIIAPRPERLGSETVSLPPPPPPPARSSPDQWVATQLNIPAPPPQTGQIDSPPPEQYQAAAPAAPAQTAGAWSTPPGAPAADYAGMTPAPAPPGAVPGQAVSSGWEIPMLPAAPAARRRSPLLMWAALATGVLLLLVLLGAGAFFVFGQRQTDTATAVAQPPTAGPTTTPTSLAGNATPPATSAPSPTLSGAASATAFAASDPALPLILEGDALTRDGKFIAAMAKYDEALARNPNSALANRQMGHTMWIWNHDAGEMEYLTRATTLAPRDPLAWAYLSFSAVDTHQSERAYAAAQEAVRLDPTLPEALAAIANTYVRYNPDMANPGPGNERAREAIERAKALDPNNIWVLWFESQVLQAFDQPEAALAPLDQAIAQRPNWATLYYGKGAILASLERRDDARALQLQALSLDPNYPFANTELGWLAYGDGDYERAKEYFLKALSITDIDTSAHDGLGYVLLQQGDYPNAVRNFQRSIGIEPRDSIAYVGLGRAYAKQGRYDEAQEAFRKGIDLRPFHTAGYIWAARTYVEQQRYAEAEAILNEALPRVKQPGYIHFWLGWVFWRQNNYDAAQPHFDEAGRLEANDSGVHYWRGVNLERLQRWDEARAAYEQALAIKPDYQEARDALDALNKRAR